MIVGGQCLAAGKRIADTADARTRQLGLLRSGNMALITASWSIKSRCPKDSDTTLRTLSSLESAYWLRIGKTLGTWGLKCSAIEPCPGARWATPMAMTSRKEVSNEY